MSSTELRDAIVAKINEGRPEAFNAYYWSHEDVLWHFQDNVRLVEDKIIDQGRWTTIQRAVYSVAISDETTDVKFFAVEFEIGSTENQDLEDDNSVAYAVTPKQVMKTEYVKEQ